MRVGKLLLAMVFSVALVAAACGGNDDDGTTPTEFPTSTDPADRIPDEQLRKLNIVLASSDLVVGPNNMAFALVDEDDQPVVVDNPKSAYFIQRDGGEFEPVMEVEPVMSSPGVGDEYVHTHADGSEHVHGGEAGNRVVYYADATFEEAGFWGMAVQAELDGEPVVADVGFNVTEASQLLLPGDPAHKSDNLTAADVDDIRMIDSGDVPNDMHDVTIAEAIENSRPVMIVFSTPAYCQTRFCGPITDEVAEMADDYGDRVDFVHIEIWRDYQAQQLNETAAEWLQRDDGGLTEPWVYLVDSNGIVYDRWEGAMDRTVMEPALEDVAGGATYTAAP